MIRQIMARFDEYQSKEHAKHVLCAMNENAHPGFWHGALAPIGDRMVAAEQRGSPTKKKPASNPLRHAGTARLSCRLCLDGEGTMGPMGRKTITGIAMTGASSPVTAGAGPGANPCHADPHDRCRRHRFNTRSHKDRERKPESARASTAVRPLIDCETFDTGRPA